jgi:hypothetical protein
MRFSSFAALASIPVALILPLTFVAGCGGGKSAAFADAGAPPPVPEDASTCPAAVPDIYCIGCGTSGVDLVCVGGNWECPSVDCPEPGPGPGPGPVPPPPSPVDGGPDACASGSPFACTSPVGCIGAYLPTCSNGQWACVWDGEACGLEAGAPEAGPPGDADPPPPSKFSCGNTACDPTTSYCQITTGGAVDDAGSSLVCAPLPTACTGAASCACIQAGQELSPIPCDCIEQGGDVVITCVAP